MPVSGRWWEAIPKAAIAGTAIAAAIASGTNLRIQTNTGNTDSTASPSGLLPAAGAGAGKTCSGEGTWPACAILWPMVYVPLAKLEAGVEAVRSSPSEHGLVELIVRRPRVEAREVMTEARVDEREGLVGDCWRERGSSATDDGSAHPDLQITIMNARSAELIAGDRARWPLAGDQLYVDLDLSVANLPPGTRLEVGSALLEVTAVPHRGCGKFSKRFGVDALKFVNSPLGRELNLRGVNTRVVRGGTVCIGDEICRQSSQANRARA